MKRTSSMVYKKTAESEELVLYTSNDATLYETIIRPTIKNLERKADKGIYIRERAVDAFYRVATAGSNKYGKDFGYRFSVQDRFTAAVDMVDQFMGI